MEEHFLKNFVSGEPSFKPEPWYSPDGDCIFYQIADEAFIAERVDELLTVYNSISGDRTIGFQIKGVNAIVKKLGIDGLIVNTHEDAEGVQEISISALLLAAYEEGPRTVSRRRAYASVMECPVNRNSIPASELQLN